MALIDVITPEAIAELRQTGLAWLDQAGRVLQDLLRDNTVELTFKVTPRRKEERHVERDSG